MRRASSKWSSSNSLAASSSRDAARRPARSPRARTNIASGSGRRAGATGSGGRSMGGFARFRRPMVPARSTALWASLRRRSSPASMGGTRVDCSALRASRPARSSDSSRSNLPALRRATPPHSFGPTSWSLRPRPGRSPLRPPRELSRPPRPSERPPCWPPREPPRPSERPPCWPPREPPRPSERPPCWPPREPPRPSERPPFPDCPARPPLPCRPRWAPPPFEPPLRPPERGDRPSEGGAMTGR